MKTTKIIGIVLIVASLYLGYLGINKVSESSAEVEVLGLEFDATNKSGKQEGFMYLTAASLLFVGGIFTFKK